MDQEIQEEWAQVFSGNLPFHGTAQSQKGKQPLPSFENLTVSDYRLGAVLSKSWGTAEFIIDHLLEVQFNKNWEDQSSSTCFQTTMDWKPEVPFPLVGLLRKGRIISALAKAFKTLIWFLKFVSCISLGKVDVQNNYAQHMKRKAMTDKPLISQCWEQQHLRGEVGMGVAAIHVWFCFCFLCF